MRTEARRVVITGVGLISPVGVGTRATFEALLAGQNGIRPIAAFDASEFSSRIAGEVLDFVPENFMDAKSVKRADRFIQFAVAAAQMALQDAGLEPSDALRAACGVICGVGFCGLATIEEAAKTLAASGPRRLSPVMIPRCIPNLAAGQIALNFGMLGPSFGVSSACASGAHALGEAARIIARGDADFMLAGGSEAAVTPLGVGGFAAMRALSTRNDDPAHASRPFDRDRDGFVMAEGAGILMLEEAEAAQSRGARIYAELAGVGMATDAYHITRPDPDAAGARRAMENALKDAGLQPNEVQHINAHGTSTPLNDKTESKAIELVFGDHAKSIAVSSNKSMTGHMLGAAGALEAGVTALSIFEQRVAPTMNLVYPDPECCLDYVPNTARELEIEAALCNSFGFGGTNVSLALRRFHS